MNFKPEMKSKEELNASLPKYESIVKYMVSRIDILWAAKNINPASW